MLYLISSNQLPLHHISSGQLVNKDGFVHPKRSIDTFVLILVTQGSLFIKQNSNAFQICANQHILLFPGMQHSGIEPSNGRLSYYWCHFQIQQKNYQFVNQEVVNQQIYIIKNNVLTTNDNYIIPETTNLFQSERVVMLYRQLLDIVKGRSYSAYFANYALSLLAMEISTVFVNSYDGGKQLHMNFRHIAEIMEWIRINHDYEVNVMRVAEEFNYNPDYLSSIFKKHVGCSLLKYINKTRIDMAKKLLISSHDSRQVIAEKAGFKDDKYFLKVFKRMEGVTPSQYKKAFHLKHMNKE